MSKHDMIDKHDKIEMNNLADRPRILTPNTNQHVLPLINHTAQNSIFASIFGFHQSTSTLAVLFGTVAHYIIFPLAAFTEIVAAVVSGINLFSAYNQNFSRVLQLLVDLAKAAGVATVVLGSIFATTMFAAITPIFFTSLLGFLAVKELGLFIWNTTQSFKNFADPDLAAVFWSEAKRNIIGAVVLGLSTAGVVTLMLSPVGPIASSIMSITTAAVLGLAAVYGVIQGVPFLKKNWDKAAGFFTHIFGGSESLEKNDNELALEQRKTFSPDEENNAKEEIIIKIDAKIKSLNKQIKNANKDKSLWSMIVERPQEAKRKGKILVLDKYREMINENKKLDDLEEVFTKNQKYKNALSCYAHQSFFSLDHQGRKGSVENISRQVENYFRMKK